MLNIGRDFKTYINQVKFCWTNCTAVENPTGLSKTVVKKIFRRWIFQRQTRPLWLRVGLRKISKL